MTPINLPILLVIVTALLAFPAGPCRAQSIDADRAAQVKAGMVLNFIRYTEWPQTAFAAADSPIVVTMLGSGAIGEQVVQTASGQQVHGRAVEVRRIEYPEPSDDETVVSEERLHEFHQQLRASHVLLICESERDRVETLLAALGTSSVLTVSDTDAFAERGGMLGLAIRRGRVAIDANQEEIKDTQLKVSSQLLRLARVVESRSP